MPVPHDAEQDHRWNVTQGFTEDHPAQSFRPTGSLPRRSPCSCSFNLHGACRYTHFDACISHVSACFGAVRARFRRVSRAFRACARERSPPAPPPTSQPPPKPPQTAPIHPKPPPNRPATHPRTATSQHRAWPHPRSTSLQHPLGTTRSTWRCESLTGASPRAPRASPAASTGCTVLLEPPRSRPWASREPLVAPPGLCVALGLGTRASGLLEATWGVPWRHRRMHPPAPAR